MAVLIVKMEAIDLFCGIGGLTYGLQQTNINVLAGLDNDQSCEYVPGLTTIVPIHKNQLPQQLV